METEGFVGCGRELIEEQWLTGLPRESRQTPVEPETCGEENSLFPLIWLIFPWGFDPLETSTQFASLIFT